jgi:hypothetical protein
MAQEYSPVTCFCQHRNEPSGPIKGGYFLDFLEEYKFCMEDPGPKH